MLGGTRNITVSEAELPVVALMVLLPDTPLDSDQKPPDGVGVGRSASQLGNVALMTASYVGPSEACDTEKSIETVSPGIITDGTVQAPEVVAL